MTASTPTLTAASAALLRMFRAGARWDDASYPGTIDVWPGDLTAAQRGNITDLINKGLITLIEECGRYDDYEIDMTSTINEMKKFRVTYGDDPSRFADGEIQEMRVTVVLASNELEARTKFSETFIESVDEVANQEVA